MELLGDGIYDEHPARSPFCKTSWTCYVATRRANHYGNNSTRSASESCHLDILALASQSIQNDLRDVARLSTLWLRT